MSLANDQTMLIDQYKSGMRRLAAGVSLITSMSGTIRAGLIATAVNSVCADPPLLLVCVNQTASAHDVIKAGGAFCVNVLPVDCLDLADQFSSAARRSERFSQGDWTVLRTGAPVLMNALVSFDCRVKEAMTYHTHTVFFGEVASVHLQGESVDPLLYVDRQFRHLAA